MDTDNGSKETGIYIDLFPIKVIRVIDDFRVVINRGSNHKVKRGQK